MARVKWRKRTFHQVKAERTYSNNNLLELGKLLEESKVFHEIKPEDREEDLYFELWNIFSDNRERTVDEIRVRLPFNCPNSEIEKIVRILENEGKLYGRKLPAAGYMVTSRGYRLAPGVTTFSDDDNNNNKPVSKRLTLGINTMASKNIVINREEGIDVSIWKVMSDRRSRTMDEVKDIMKEYGFRVDQTGDRLIFLAYKGWFTRNGSGKRTMFTLQKSIKMPELPKKEVLAEEPKLNTTTTYFERKPEELKPVYNIPVLTSSVIRQEEVQPEVIQPVKEEVKVEKKIYVVEKGEPVNLSIWKVFSDGSSLTPREVGLLLEDFGFNPKSVSIRISELHNHQKWFTRIAEGKSFRYTLKPETAMPEKEQPKVEEQTPPETTNPQQSLLPEKPAEQVKDAVPEVKKEEAQEQPVAIKEVQGEEMNTTSVPTEVLEKINGTSPESTPVQKREFKESHLLSFKVVIKGQSFSLDQTKLLTDELLSAGYGQGKVKVSTGGMLQTKHRIRDQEFTDTELEELAFGLLESGFGPEGE